MSKSKDLKIEEPGAPSEQTPPAALVDPKSPPQDPPPAIPTPPPVETPVPKPAPNPTTSTHVDPTRLRPTERVLTAQGWVVPASADQIVDRNHPAHPDNASRKT